MEYSDVCRSFLPLLLLVGGGWNLLMLLREQQPVVLIWFRGIIRAVLGGRERIKICFSFFLFPRPTYFYVSKGLAREKGKSILFLCYS